MEDHRSPDDLRPVLEQTEAEVAERLMEACELESRDISEESTGELMRLDDALLAAARATERAIALRQQIKPAAERAAPAEHPAVEGGAASAVREFRDAAGRPWRAWAVTPGRVRTVSDPKRYFGEYRDGWLAFESLESGARRRLPHYPAGWLQMEDEALRGLLESATEVERAERRPDGESERRPGRE